MYHTVEHWPAASVSAEFDPFELPDTLQITDVPDPYPYLAEARRRGPVQREWPLPTDLVPVDAGEQLDEQAFSVLGRDEVLAVLRDDRTYSSAVLAEIMSPVLDGALIALDEPEHRAHRALIAPAFRPKLLARWRDDLVARVVDELLDEVIEAGHADLVRRLTFAFPVRVIARILGLPERDSERFQRWSIELISILVRWDRGIAAHEALQGYFAECTAERRRHPRDDLISELIETEVDGTRLTDADIFRFLELLLPAGVETTYRSFGNTLFALLTHPDQLEEVLGVDELRAAAIEEALRWETPLLVVPRRCTRDTTLAGVDIPAGADLTVFLGSANRDERHYTDPDRFDVHRPLTPIASFGSGPHACLGMHLARMEMRVALDAVLDRLEGLRLDREAPRPQIVGGAFRSPDALPVTFAV
jgi:cytochrome P450